MFGELLVAVLPADLEVAFGQVSCPARLVAVTIANTGTADERYALRVAGRVQRTELVPAGTTVVSRVRLPEDRPTTIAVHTEGRSVASAERTADCADAASASPEPKGGAPAPAESAAPLPGKDGEQTPGPEDGTPKGGESTEGTPSLPSWRNVPGLAPPPPKGEPHPVEGSAAGTPSAEPSSPENGVAGRGEGTPPAAPASGTRGAGSSVEKEKARGTRSSAAKKAAAATAVERKAGKAKKRREAAAREARRRAWRRTQPETLPMTGISPAFGYTGLGTAITGGVLAWYALLWPRRRTTAFAARERSR